MKDVLLGFSLIFSTIAVAISILAFRFVHNTIKVLATRKSRTIVVDMKDGKIVVIKEWTNDAIDARAPD